MRPDPIVEVVPYDPSWPARFETERRVLAEALPDALSIEHIGSTSVPGLAAKPTIDILAVLPDPSAALRRLARLEAAGYEYKPGSFADREDHLFFRKVVGGKRTHHLHVLARSSAEPAEYRLFREFLIARPDVASRYEQAKLQLAARYPKDRSAYVAAKERMVDRLMHEARVWGEETGYGCV